MKIKQINLIAVILFLSSSFLFAQRPPRSPQGQRPPRGEINRLPRNEQNKPPRDENRHDNWLKKIDSNKSGKIEIEEYQSAANEFFRKNDRNADGILEEIEIRPGRAGFNPSPENIPPFLFLERGVFNLSATDFDAKIRQRFAQFDANGDGVIDRKEFEKIKPPREEEHNEKQTPPPPTAEFLGAEMRFGDKLIEGAPFSAEILIENSRRLFDGSIVKKQSKGAIYRDGAGRTRRERTLEDIGGFSIGEPQSFVVINDFAAKVNYFIDLNRKTVRRNPLTDNRPPNRDIEPKNGKSESLGTKILEGINVEGTRTTFEIPVGQIGNNSPIEVVTEKWFSPELQLVVMSKHTDPLAGEQIFRLVNIKLGEPSADMFTAPSGFKVEK